MVITLKKLNLLFLDCATDTLPGFNNAMITNGDTVAAPYENNDVVRYACNSGYTKNPSDAALTCSCAVANANAAGTWTCNPTGAAAAIACIGKCSIFYLFRLRKSFIRNCTLNNLESSLVLNNLTSLN